jgi:hypothetical protein
MVFNWSVSTELTIWTDGQCLLQHISTEAQHRIFCNNYNSNNNNNNSFNTKVY